MLISVTNNFQIRGTILSTSNKEAAAIAKKLCDELNKIVTKYRSLTPYHTILAAGVLNKFQLSCYLAKKNLMTSFEKSQRDNKKGA